MNTSSQTLPFTCADDRDASSRAPAQPGVLTLGLTDMHCAACAAFIEDSLRRQRGVFRVHVHFATQRARVVFDAATTCRSELVDAIQALGYGTEASTEQDQGLATLRTRRQHLWLFGLATLCAMQLMMLTVPRYLAGNELEPDLAALLDWSAFALVLPVIFVASRPFVLGAVRELRIRRPGMDSAVALGIVTAFAGSCWHLLRQSGSLYFDSIAMFIALLLAVRWFEWEQRERNRAQIAGALAQQGERRVRRVVAHENGHRHEEIRQSALCVGDQIYVRTGEVVAADGRLESGFAECDESLLTGESSPVLRLRGETLFSGAVNSGPAILLSVTATAEDSTERRLLSLADQSCKPASLRLSERVARWFMPLLLLASALCFVALLPQGVELAIERAIAVMIISCPCALALAAPAAYARAFALLIGRGVVVRRDGALERLAAGNCFVLDKTGTLTEPAVEAIDVRRNGADRQWCETVIAALEQSANHPLAQVFRSRPADVPIPAVADAHWQPGEGVEGTIAGIRYRFGRPAFASAEGASLARPDAPEAAAALWLCDRAGVICAVTMGETLKSGARQLIETLKRRGSVELCSGDAEHRVARVARELAIPRWRSSMTPAQKASRVKTLQADGHTVVMIGDGINDSLGFAGADAAIATGGSTDTARASADFVCCDTHLAAVIDCLHCADTTVRVVKSNFAWAIGYNFVAIPCAVLGMVNPLFAGIGMAGSSAIVMLNVLRIRRRAEGA